MEKQLLETDLNFLRKCYYYLLGSYQIKPKKKTCIKYILANKDKEVENVNIKYVEFIHNQIPGYISPCYIEYKLEQIIFRILEILRYNYVDDIKEFLCNIILPQLRILYMKDEFHWKDDITNHYQEIIYYLASNDYSIEYLNLMPSFINIKYAREYLVNLSLGNIIIIIETLHIYLKHIIQLSNSKNYIRPYYSVDVEKMIEDEVYFDLDFIDQMKEKKRVYKILFHKDVKFHFKSEN